MWSSRRRVAAGSTLSLLAHPRSTARFHLAGAPPAEPTSTTTSRRGKCLQYRCAVQSPSTDIWTCLIDLHVRLIVFTLQSMSKGVAIVPTLGFSRGDLIPHS